MWLLYLTVGFGWVVLLEKLSGVHFEPHELVLMLLLWPLAAPIALIGLVIL